MDTDYFNAESQRRRVKRTEGGMDRLGAEGRFEAGGLRPEGEKFISEREP